MKEEWNKLENELEHEIDSLSVPVDWFNKSRYVDVIPQEKYRVKLLGQPDDYINASWVINLNQSYIATQGPMGNTIADFWTMVWQTGSTNIIMLCNFFENDSEKCAYYFPLKGERSMKLTTGMTIEFVNQNNQSHSYIIRTLKIHRGDGGETRLINHYQFIAWPDHGTPDKHDEFLEFINLISQRVDHRNMIVHCSAGIGRTGVFILIHSVFKVKKAEELGKMVQNLRVQRTGMVQSYEQYQFTFDVIQEILMK